MPITLRFRILLVAALAVLALPSIGLCQETEAEALATLADEVAPLFHKAIACKRIAVIGTEAAIPTLEKLLDDDDLAHYARYALEPIPSPKVDEVLMSALGELSGKHLIGAINSLANRGKPEAIDSLATKLNDADARVAKAAAHAIGRLGTPKAGEVLGTAISPDFAAAALVGAKTMAEQGHTSEAGKLFAAVYKQEDAPAHVRLAARLQAVAVLGDAGADLLSQALLSDREAEFAAGLRTARLAKAGIAAKAVLGAIDESPASRTARLVRLLGDLGDASGLPAVVKAAGADEEAIRVAALEALAVLGNADHISLLLEAVGDESPAVSAQAAATLAALEGEEIDAAILAQIDQEESQAAVIRMIGKRRITAAVPKLISLLNGPNRYEVLAALGETIELDKLDLLGAGLKAPSPELREAVRGAINAACLRMTNRDATAEKLQSYMQGGSEETVAFIMNQLAKLGGKKALTIVSTAAQGDNDFMKDYATRALGEWLDVSAADVLIELAEAEGTGKYGVRGLRGYIRLPRQFAMTDGERAKMCRTAWELAQRDEERQLVLDVLRQYPSVHTLDLAIDAKETASMQKAARGAVAAITNKLGRRGVDVASLTELLEGDPVEIEILKAEFGAEGAFEDVTSIVAAHAGSIPVVVLPSDKFNTAFGGDPAPGTPKVLKIHYKMNGHEGEVTIRENRQILLPMPE
jgi:HEAT repeat protein